VRDGDSEERNEVALKRGGGAMLDTILCRVGIETEYCGAVVVILAQLLGLAGDSAWVDVSVIRRL
jgi:hypothetical protein